MGKKLIMRCGMGRVCGRADTAPKSTPISNPV